MPRLVDGTDVASDSPAWRQECLARYVLAMPMTARRAWLAELDARNKVAGQELRQVIEAVHADRKRHKVTKANTD